MKQLEFAGVISGDDKNRKSLLTCVYWLSIIGRKPKNKLHHRNQTATSKTTTKMKSLVPKFLRKDKLSKGVSERTTDTTKSVVPSENLKMVCRQF